LIPDPELGRAQVALATSSELFGVVGGGVTYGLKGGWVEVLEGEEIEGW